jgi:hypothetical protein
MSNYLPKNRDNKGKFIRSSDSDERQKKPNELTCLYTHTSHDTLWKIKVIYNSGDKELIKRVDKKEISINAAHKLISNTNKTEIEKHKGFKFKKAFPEIVNELSGKTFKNNAELLAELKKINNICFNIQNQYALITVFIDYAQRELKRSKTPIMESLNDVLEAFNTGKITKEYLRLTFEAINNIQNGK